MSELRNSIITVEERLKVKVRQWAEQALVKGVRDPTGRRNILNAIDYKPGKRIDEIVFIVETTPYEYEERTMRYRPQGRPGGLNG